MTSRIEQVREAQRRFVRERDWDKFHTPKNVAMALGGEVGELAEAISPILDTTPADGATLREPIMDEVGDMTLYVLRLHDVADVPLPSSVFDGGGDFDYRSDEPASQRELSLAVFQLMSSTGRVMEIYQWASDADHLSAPQEDSKIVGRLRAVTADPPRSARPRHPTPSLAKHQGLLVIL
jgi:NTP pyrophosphatase (non-canonical NTP hydrolase)